MIPAAFEYAAPKSVTEALAMLTQRPEAKVMAGGQSLLSLMKLRAAAPPMVIDIGRIRDLAYIKEAGDKLLIGALTTHQQIESSKVIRERCTVLAEAAEAIGDLQVRNRGTIGGSLVHADPAAELPVVAVALNARLRARNADGERWIPAETFFQGMFTTDLAPDEILTEIAIPVAAGRTGTAFVEFSRRRGDYALMGVAAVLHVDPNGVCRAARLVYLNAGDGPVLAPEASGMLVGRRIDTAAADEAAAHAAAKEISPSGNLHATPAFQRHLARVLGRRAVETAAQRAA
jgi:carbon-monoxide dehydrogenase medium subunit